MENRKKLYKLFKEERYSEIEEYFDSGEIFDIELELRVKAFLSYLDTDPLSGEKAVSYYSELGAMNSKYYLDIALIFLNKKDVQNAIFFLEKVVGDDLELARFYLAFIFSYREFGVQDSNASLEILRHDLNVNHLCSRQLYCKVMMHFEKSYVERIFINLKKIGLGYKCIFISFINPTDDRLSSRGAFELFDLRMQGLLDDLYSDEDYFNVHSRVFFDFK
jgi:hypothetical protein